ncbi:hypothetical protein [Burkholderia cepacia]|uniref:hypothetical protein n=1 Tax=Burkholderia cepacia TaxID=292 RepID=UPI0018A69126|nr:hypothetical protein [Burkholderia cepacia]QOH36076.1 transcriptional regulator, HxlR family [Burkholderia cepacia]
MTKKIELPPDAFLKVCPSRAVLARIGQKWTVLAMVAMKDGPMRLATSSAAWKVCRRRC